MIHLPESAELRRKATLLRRIAVLVFAAQKPPGKRIAGSGNSDARFSGNSGAQSSGNSDRFELAPSSQTLAAPSSSEGRDDRHAQTARDSGSSTRRSQSNRNRDARRRLPPKRPARL